MTESKPVSPKALDAVARMVMAIERPDPALLWLYAIQLLLLFPVTLMSLGLIALPYYFRYQTLRYRFDDDGVHASWGILFRREVSLPYARIQDIHLRRGVVERWLGIGTVSIQTASGSTSAELSIEGMRFFTEVRDFLYGKMRGAHLPKRAAATASPGAVDAEAIALLREIHVDLRAVRERLDKLEAKPPERVPDDVDGAPRG